MSFTVRFLPSGRIRSVPRGHNLLEAVKDAGLPIASACGADGVCARCGLQILEGAASLRAETDRETAIKERNRIDPVMRLACRVEVAGDLVVTASYW